MKTPDEIAERLERDGFYLYNEWRIHKGTYDNMLEAAKALRTLDAKLEELVG